MPDIVLATLNAKYIHASFGLRYLLANLGELRSRAILEEFIINQRPLEIAEKILAHNPRIVGLGVYIWNVTLTTELVAILKKIRPDVIVVLGGPEVSYESDQQEIVRLADYTITGEGDLAFAELCRQILAGTPPPQKIIAAPLPDFGKLALPYDEYNADDIAHRLIYVEASRGCPFSCEFCLSSLDIPVRQAPIDTFLATLERLLARGVLHFKFVDRTFNLNLATSRRILEFFLERLKPGLFLHFEMVPDRLPPELRELIARFPAGTMQLEVGIQTFNADVATLISRRQDYVRLEDNFRYLRAQTGVHLHADLIAGLPGETLESFASGFDRLVALAPQEIQVGILKRLRGTPISRHDQTWEMVYSPLPTYEILRNKLIDFSTMQRLRRFARYWDLVGNSGNFVETTPLVWAGRDAQARTVSGRADGPSSAADEAEHRPDLDRTTSIVSTQPSPFHSFLRLSDWLATNDGRHHALALVTLMELLFSFLTTELHQEQPAVAAALWRDFQRGGRGELPPFLRPYLPGTISVRRADHPATRTTRRQSRHTSDAASAPASGRRE
ncbi:MAG: DUF4080 domain-containing protein [Verrucomicrobia bacterium]|nr:DUF4080 domain-containing protein [Verrucomicrobiota bacterium]